MEGAYDKGVESVACVVASRPQIWVISIERMGRTPSYGVRKTKSATHARFNAGYGDHASMVIHTSQGE